MPKFEKKINKLLVGAILGTTLLGVAWASMTPKWKSLMGKVKDFIKGWIDELKKNSSRHPEQSEGSREVDKNVKNDKKDAQE